MPRLTCRLLSLTSIIWAAACHSSATSPDASPETRPSASTADASRATPSPEVTTTDAAPADASPPPEETHPDAAAVEARPRAHVLHVSATGSPSAYRFSVRLESPDTGCDQYANWWEVITPEGQLIYRRILAHSHVDEQPFTRSGGPVPISADQTVIIRAHMSNGGYGGQAMRGHVAEGFSTTTLEAGFAAGLAEAAPQPGRCAF